MDYYRSIEWEMKSEYNFMTCPMSVSNLVIKAKLEFLALVCDIECVSLYSAAPQNVTDWDKFQSY